MHRTFSAQYHRVMSLNHKSTFESTTCLNSNFRIDAHGYTPRRLPSADIDTTSATESTFNLCVKITDELKNFDFFEK